ncbi:MAG: amidohydrolase family protein [SAR202 cluster bacterium]|nr:amidohydrolase family protein [SAR202 cluster bacterium]
MSTPPRDAKAPKTVDLLVTNGVIVTVDAQRRILMNCAIAVDKGRIVDVGLVRSLESTYSARQKIDARGAVVHPGYVDCHVHLAQQLGRGTIPDTWPEEKELTQWLPYWTNMTEEDGYCSAMLSCLEMVRNGTTTFCENGGRFRSELTAEVADRVGLRGGLSEICWDVPPHESVSIGDTDACLRSLERQLDALPCVAGRRVWAIVGMAGMGRCTDRLLVEAKKLAESRGVLMDLHQSFGPEDVSDYLEHTKGVPAAAYLEQLGVLGPATKLIHMIHAEEMEVPVLARTDTSVTHCPAASLRVGMGVSRFGRFPEMVQQGVNVTLGSDSGNYSDAFDIGHQAYLATTIHREARGVMPTITAEQAFEMATINGARAMGIADELGSIEPGKKADIVIQDRTRPEWHPGLDPMNSLLYSARSGPVHTVIVDGEIILRKGEFTRVDAEAELARIDRAGRSLYRRMGFNIQHRWPVVGE